MFLNKKNVHLILLALTIFSTLHTVKKREQQEGMHLRSGRVLNIRRDMKCNICLEKFRRMGLATIMPCCNGAFHAKCIRQWDEQMRCPICKRGEVGAERQTAQSAVAPFPEFDDEDVISEQELVYDEAYDIFAVIFHAWVNGDFSQVQYLISYDNACVNDIFCGNKPLHLAAMLGLENVITMLLNAGASINAQNICGSTALYAAARFGRINSARILLEHGADKTITDNNGDTPCAIAGHLGEKNIVRLLLPEQESEIDREVAFILYMQNNRVSHVDFINLNEIAFGGLVAWIIAH